MSFRHFLLLGALLVSSLSALRADVASPVIVQAVPDQVIARAGTVTPINLSSYVQDPNVLGTAVRITTRVGTLGTGNIDIALTDSQTPQTVANFLAYINAGYYTNNFIHRSDPGGVVPPAQGFVIQGGGYGFFPNGSGGLAIEQVPPFSPVPNEPGLSNVRGTIAMAKLSGNADSATSQWFINLSDSNTFLDSPANGAFTVFGNVIGNGMAVADIVSELPIYNYGSPFDQLPLTANVVSDTGNFVVTSMAVVPAVTYSVTSSNTSLVTASVSGNILTITPSSSSVGTTNITVTATDLEGNQLQTSCNVTVLDTYDTWAAGINFANPTVAAETANPAGDGVTNLAKYAFGGDPLHAAPIAGLPKAESGGGVRFYSKQLSALAYQVYESPDLTNWTLIWQSSDGFSSAEVGAYTPNVATGFDAVTIRDSTGGFSPIRFWQVKVTGTL